MAENTSSWTTFEASSFGRTDDPAWAYGKVVEGMRSHSVCIFCDKHIKGGGIRRLKYHLAGIKGDVSACEKVTDNVKFEMKQLIEKPNTRAKDRRRMVTGDIGLRRSEIDRIDTFGEGSHRSVDVMKLRFSTELAARTWYNAYAKENGFSIRLDKRRRFTSGKTRTRNFVCSKQGTRVKAHLCRVDRVRQHRYLTRRKCRARLLIGRTDEGSQFCVRSFFDTHTHQVSPAQCTYLLRSHRKVSASSVTQILALKKVGIGTSKAFESAVYCAGGFGSVGFTLKDVYNTLAKPIDKIMGNSDARDALRWLHGHNTQNGDIFYRYALDKESRLQCLFFCDSRCQLDYTRFGDVLVFDTTYRTNAYKKPLVILCGVNNHWQTSVFAAAILSDETIETYIWVLEQLMVAVGNRQPQSVITDGDMAMRRAIELVLPAANHRLCEWHLMRNAKTNVPKAGFLSDFRRAMNFEGPKHAWKRYWKAIESKYGLSSEHRWARDTFVSRKLWAAPYLSGKVFCGMNTTQRCESMNHYFKDYINHKMRLLDLIQSFFRGLEKIRHKERMAHIITDQSRAVVTTREFAHIEGHAEKVYTRNLFIKYVRPEISRAPLFYVDYLIDQACNDHIVYAVRRKDNTEGMHFVGIHRQNLAVDCTCEIIASLKILCSHSILALVAAGINFIPDPNIADRWSATDRDFYTSDPRMVDSNLNMGTEKGLQMGRIASMKTSLDRIISSASKSSNGFDILANVVAVYEPILKEAEMKAARSENVENNTDVLFSNVRDPRTADPKESGRKTRKCSLCNRPGHNRSRCIHTTTEHQGEEDEREEFEDEFEEFEDQFM